MPAPQTAQTTHITRSRLADSVADQHRDWSPEQVLHHTDWALRVLRLEQYRLRHQDRKFHRLMIPCGSTNNDDALVVMAGLERQERLRRDDWERSAHRQRTA